MYNFNFMGMAISLVCIGVVLGVILTGVCVGIHWLFVSGYPNVGWSVITGALLVSLVVMAWKNGKSIL